MLASVPPKRSHAGILGSRSVLGAIALVAAVYVASLLFLPRAGLWTLDNSVKYLQVQALSSSGLRSSALNWAGGHITSPTQCSPIPVPFGLVENGQLQGIYSPFFALVSVPPFRLFGFRGLVLLPLLATLLMLVGLTRLARGVGLDQRGQAWVVVVAGLATPVWFYAALPLVKQTYELEMDGGATLHGRTSIAGLLHEPIPIGAISAIVRLPDLDVEFAVDIRDNPLSQSNDDVATRLSNLGYLVAEQPSPVGIKAAADDFDSEWEDDSDEDGSAAARISSAHDDPSRWLLKAG